MKRSELEHIVGAVAAITRASEIGIVGSESILGQFPTPPWELMGSRKADVFTFRNPADSRLIEGCLGEGSTFHQTFGYYAQGVIVDSTALPKDWQRRLVPLPTESAGPGVGWCLEIHDLAVSDLIQGHEGDLALVSGLLRHGLVDFEVLRARLNLTPLREERKNLAAARLRLSIET
jgi:hypothetical protein